MSAVHTMGIRAGAFLIAAVAVTAGCHRDPGVAYAHLLERAASWSASARFADDIVRRGGATRGYLHDVLTTGARELSSIGNAIEKYDDVSPGRRSADAAACRQLAALLEKADRQASVEDDGALRDVESHLRAAADRARSADALETRR